MNKSYISRMKSNTGFTLAETLLTVAIMVILMGVAFVNAKSMRDNARQASMDQTAKTMYMALSENMKLIETTGNVSGFDDEAKKAVDADKTLKSGNMYVTSRADVDELGGTSDLRNYLIPTGSVTDEIFQGDWTIIYDTGEDSVNNDKVTYRSPSILAVYYTPQSSEIEYYNDVISKISPGTETADESGILTVYAAETEPDVDAGNKSDKGFLYSDKQERLNKFNGLLGYYDGKASEKLPSTQKTEDDFVCWYEVDNGEELLVHVYVNVPDDKKYKNDTGSATVNLYLTLAGSKGSVTLDKTLDNILDVNLKNRNGFTRVAEYTFVLDSLKNDGDHQQFKNLTYTYKDDTGNKIAQVSSIITPGENIGLSVAADCNGYNAAQAETANSDKVVNTLYAKSTPAKDGDTSYESIEVSCGRHLQNLDRSLSGFATTKDEVRVKLTDNIDFAKNSEGEKENKSWFATYGNASFYPINNNKIATFDGNDKSISNLVITEETVEQEGKQSCKMTAAGKAAIEQTVSGTDNATKAVQNHKNNNGLFAVFYGYKLENITLINPIVNCTENADTATNAGALAGTLAGEIVDNSKTITINKCGVHLDSKAAADSENKNTYLKNTNVNDNSWKSANEAVWIKGNTCIGGLVGNVATGGNVKAIGLTITNSYSATVVKAGMAKSYGGGLVGQSALKMNVDTSYADCYISAGNVGGLVGNATKDMTFTDCYSAGFVLQGENNSVGDLVKKAAGYTPSNVNVTLSGKNYSLFNYDDVTSATFTTEVLTFKDDGVVDKYPDKEMLVNDTVDDTKIVGFFSPKAAFADTSAKAYFTYGDLVSATDKGAGEYMSVGDMKKSTKDSGLGLSSKAISGENPTEISYNLSLQSGQPEYTSGYINRHKLTLPVFWSSSDAPIHYGDWLEKPGSKVKKYKINFVDVRNDEVVKTDEITTDNEAGLKESIFRSFTKEIINTNRGIPDDKGKINNKYSFIGFDRATTLSDKGQPEYRKIGISWQDFILDSESKGEWELEQDGSIYSIKVYLHWTDATYADFAVSNTSNKMQDGDNVIIVGLKNDNKSATGKVIGYAFNPKDGASQTAFSGELAKACSLSNENNTLTVSTPSLFKDYLWNVSSVENFLKEYPTLGGGLTGDKTSGLVIYSTVHNGDMGTPYIFTKTMGASGSDLIATKELSDRCIWYYGSGNYPYILENGTAYWLKATSGKLAFTWQDENDNALVKDAKIYRGGTVFDDADVDVMKLISELGGSTD